MIFFWIPAVAKMNEYTFYLLLDKSHLVFATDFPGTSSGAQKLYSKVLGNQLWNDFEGKFSIW